VYGCDHIDLLEMKPVVTRINIHSGSCVRCGKQISGTPPAGMPPDSPFGSGIAALAIYQYTRHMVSYNLLWKCSRG
jgi:transposase